ncbi:Peroxiredoxin [Pedobacter steynii]|uniref:Peroxiredoxin n=1 Tax=Pedobacter steynii TaxID=430522 RepID=A0A1G9JLK6_9SPHI|nr:TlpA disulfide reductase family protein [Pedobacter steynii]NQX38292.1 AhpC/TSA family protein [Pedobacter steynii]SDL38388.1 Peroxiredoxin [Pedobacter steynii]
MKFIPLIFLFWVQSTCLAQNTVSLEIHAPKFKNGSKLQISDNNPFGRKSLRMYDLEIVNGKSIGKILTGKGDLFRLKFNQQNRNFYLEPGIIKINIPDTSLALATITGSKSDQQMAQWLIDWKNEPIYNRTRDAQNKWFAQGTTAEAASSKLKYDSLNVIYEEQKVSFNINRIKANPAFCINSTLLRNIMDLVPQKQVLDLYQGLDSEAKSNVDGRFIKYQIDSLSINGTAPGFVQSDTSGNQVRLDDFRGKYLLLDFWASWCIPCRAENPNLKKAYEQFKHRNFTILGVSLDSERKLWIDAIKKDQLPWAQISDLQGWSNWISAKYIVRAVPRNFLISPDGKIIAKNIRGKELIETLEKALQ